MSDPAKYRQKEEVERWRLNDPLERTLMALKTIYQVPEAELDAMDETIVAEMDARLRVRREGAAAAARGRGSRT